MSNTDPAPFPEFFERLTGNHPYPYQERFAALWEDGNSLILRAPTGAGKTWTVVAPFLHSVASGRRFADRLIYALPLRTLASGIHRSVADAVSQMPGAFAGVASSAKSRVDSDTLHCSLQMGGEKNDPFFESDLVFTTIDQLLSGYLMLPVSLPKRLGNMVAGALIGSAIVIDEAHLLDPSVALGTMIEMLHRLRGLCQFVIMSATISDTGAQWIAGKLGATVFTIPEVEVRALPSQSTKHREWSYVPRPLAVGDVLAAHKGGRTIALVNTVRRAQQLYTEIANQTHDSSTEVTLLHSRFFPDHRRTKETAIVDSLGPKAVRTNVILVTTQVIEAGIDISADHLLTDLAPMNALIQRAGRVARYPKRHLGYVSVFSVESPSPYQNEKPLLESTLAVLDSLPSDGAPIDFAEEQQWVDRVHGPREAQTLAAYDNIRTVRDKVHRAMHGDEGLFGQLVRDIDSVNVIITGDPEDLNFSGYAHGRGRIGWPAMLSVSRSSVHALRPAFDSVPHGAWIGKTAVAREDERPGLCFDWIAAGNANQLASAWLIAIHPDYASYSSDTGLVFAQPGPELPVDYAERPPLPAYSYQFESWSDHANRVRAQARRLHSLHRHAAKLLSSVIGPGITPDQVEWLVEFTCFLHDTGKLSDAWQQTAWRWQRDKDQRLKESGQEVPQRPQVALAHTTFHPVHDRDFRYLPEYRFPNHAVEGAFAIEEYAAETLVNRFGETAGLHSAVALISAVARHHAARSHTVSQFAISSLHSTLFDEVETEGQPLLSLRNCDGRVAALQFEKSLFSPLEENHDSVWPIYAFLARRLRLADQGSFV